MAFLTRDQILGATDIKTETVDVPEWGGEVLVRSLTGKQRDEFEATMMERRGKKMVPNTANMRAKLVAWSVVSEQGERLFTQADIADLGEHSAAAIHRVYLAAAELSGLTDDDIGEEVENFGETNGSSSSTGSRKRSASPSEKS